MPTWFQAYFMVEGVPTLPAIVTELRGGFHA